MNSNEEHKALIVKAKEIHGLTDAGLAQRIGATQSAVNRWLSGCAFRTQTTVWYLSPECFSGGEFCWSVRLLFAPP